MTTPGINPPEDAYVPGTQFGQDKRDMSVDDAKSHLNVPVEDAFSGMEGFLPGIVNMIAGNYEGDIDPFVDGQLALNERFDLLDNVSGFAVAYIPYNYLQGGTRDRYYTAPFEDRLGPEKNATVEGDGTITLAKGTWHVNCQLTTDTNDNNNGLFLRVEILYPEDDPRIEETGSEVYSYKDMQQRIAGGMWSTLQLFHPVVCDEPGFRVRARLRIWPGSILKTRIRGGTTVTHLSVNRLDLSTENGVPAGDVPDGPDIDEGDDTEGDG